MTTAAAKRKTSFPEQPQCLQDTNGFVFSLAAKPHRGLATSETEPHQPSGACNLRNAEEIAAELRRNRIGVICFGDEITSTSNDREKFATYTRDSYTGLDYADQRYYASTYGRFNTPDPYQASGGPSDPSSWNRYSYTRGDPVNRMDPGGTCDISISGTGWDDGLIYYTDCMASLSPAMASYAMFCMSDPVCYSSHMQQQAGGGSLTVSQQGPGGQPGDPRLAAQVAQAGLSAVGTTAFSPQCHNFIDSTLGADVLESVQELALGAVAVTNASTVNAAAGVTLFPNNPNLAAAQQATADQITGVAGATLAQLAAASPTTSAWGQFGGNTVFYTSAFAGYGSGMAMYTMLHELLHVDGFGDAQIEAAFGITPQIAAAQGTTSITYALMGACGQ